MQEKECYENYPLWIPALSLSVMIAIYSLGAYILLRFGILWAILYIGYCVCIEIWVLKGSCVNCYYYGKVCGLGKGKLCAKLFKKGDLQKFVEAEVSWIKILPDFLTIIIPIVCGIIYIIKIYFSLLLLIILIIQFCLYFIGTALIRGNLTCKHCKQRELGCPAAKIFMKEDE